MENEVEKEKRPWITLILLVIIIILAISSYYYQNSYTKTHGYYMKKGKELLKNNDFENAVSFFEKALIEEPSDVDARFLHDKARHEIQLTKFKSRFPEYIENNKDNFITFLDYITIGRKALGEGASVDDHYKRIEELQQLEKKSDGIRLMYLDIDEISRIHSLFKTAILEEIDFHYSVIKAMELIEKEQHNTLAFRAVISKMGEHNKKSRESMEKYALEVKKARE